MVPDALTVDVEAPPSDRSDGDRLWWTLAWASVALGVVLRLWGLGGQDLTFDEAFTGSAARKSIGELVPFLRSSDTHPPLDYVLRMPFAQAGDELLLRLPSAAFSIAALVLIASWMRNRGAFGAFTTIAASVMPFLVIHGREARMYSLVMLLGVIAAICAERWLQRPRAAYAIGVAGAGLLAMLSHSATMPAVAAMLLLPGIGRDREAWTFRAWVGGAFLAWAAIWGLSFREQVSVVSSFWIPLTSWDSLESAGGGLVSPRSALTSISFVVLLLGVWALLTRRDGLVRVAALAFVLPFVGIALAGLQLHLLLPRSIAFGSWAVAASLGAGVDWMRSRLGPRGAGLGVVLIIVLLTPSTLQAVRNGREQLSEMDELHRRLQPGDQISISPAWFGPLLEWNFVAKRGFEVVDRGEDGGRFVVADPTAEPSGRHHLLDHQSLPMDDRSGAGRPRCESDLEGASWLLRCTEDEALLQGEPGR